MNLNVGDTFWMVSEYGWDAVVWQCTVTARTTKTATIKRDTVAYTQRRNIGDPNFLPRETRAEALLDLVRRWEGHVVNARAALKRAMSTLGQVESMVRIENNAAQRQG